MANAKKLIQKIQNKTRGSKYRKSISFQRGTVLGNTYRSIAAKNARNKRK